MKFIAPLLFLLLALFWGCQSAPPPQGAWHIPNGKVKVLSTTAMIDDLVGEIGKERIDHLPLIQGELDPHSYELVKGDQEKIAFAELFIGNGLNLEHGASLCYQLHHHRNPLFLAETIRQKAPEKILTVGKEIDPHLWMDISLWAEGIDPIVEALSQLDPDSKTYFEENGALLKERLCVVHRELQTELKKVDPKRRYLVTSHDAFHYFARAYLSQENDGETRCIAPEGLAPEGQLSHQDIERVICQSTEHEVKVVFPESNVNRDPLKKVVSCCSYKMEISKKPLYGDAFGGPGSGAESYLDMMRHNGQVLREAWNE